MNKNLNFIAPVGTTGYGVTGFHLLKELSKREYHVSLFPKGPSYRTEYEQQLIQFSQINARFYDKEAPCIQLWHQFDLAYRVGKGKYYGWPIFELDSFTEHEKHQLNSVDELIVCSNWAKDVCINNGVKVPIHVIPLGYDPDIFRVSGQAEKRSTTVFLNVGKWEIRKGHDMLSDAFNLAFKPEDDVELWLLPFNPFLSKDDAKNWENLYLDSTMGKAGKIKIWGWQQNHSDVCKIMQGATYGVFPSRAEGWNLELLEMLALEKPCIATYYSGHTEFCNTSNSLLISVDETEPAYDGKWFFEQGNWASLGESQIDQLIGHMRLLHRDKDANFNWDFFSAKQFTWENSANLLEKILTN